MSGPAPRVMRDALVLVAHAPAARLGEALPGEDAWRLVRAFMADAVAASASLSVDQWCSLDPDVPAERLELPPTIRVVPRPRGSYAEHLVAIADEMFSRLYRKVLIMGADAPAVDTAYLQAALDALDNNDAVIGPALDGGYVLVGLTKPIPRLFLEIDMGTNDVLRQTLYRARDLELRMGVLPVRPGASDLVELRTAAGDGLLAHAPRTLEALGGVQA